MTDKVKEPPVDYENYVDTYEIVMIFPIPTEEDAEKKYDREELIDLIDDLFYKKSAEDFDKNCRVKFPKVYNVYHSADDGEVTREDLLVLVREAVIEVLYKKCGLKCYLFYSRDKDEILCKVADATPDESNLLVFAEEQRYSLPLKKSLEHSEFFANSPVAHHEFDYEKRDKWERQVDENGDECYLLPKDKMRVMIDCIQKYVDLAYFGSQSGLGKEYYCLHNKKRLDELRTSWARLGLWCSLEQPIHEIRDYFGEKIAMYFAWLENYTKWLKPVAIIATVLYAVQVGLKYTPYAKEGEYIGGLVGIIMAVWSSIFCEFWARKEKAYAVKWGTESFDENEVTRPEFHGIKQENHITGEIEKFYSPTRRNWQKSVGFCLVGVIVVTVVSLVVNLMMWKQQKMMAGEKAFAYTAAGLNTLQIKVFNFAWTKLATKLNNWENYRTQTEYEDALILKIFLFQFVNSYNSLFYLTFYKPYYDTISGYCDTDGADCDYIGQLAISVGTIFCTSVALNVVELGLPWMMMKREIANERKSVEKKAETGEVGKDYLRLWMYPSERQSKLAAYAGTFPDYLEIVIQFGYVTMFCAGFPPVVLLGFLNNCFEIRIDAIKLVDISQRPYPAGAEDIGTWSGIVKTISVISVITNLAILLFTANIFDINNLATSLAVFIVVEHIVLMLKAMIGALIPDISAKTQQLIERHQIIIRRKVFGFNEESFEHLEKKLKQSTPDYNLIEMVDLKEYKTTNPADNERKRRGNVRIN